ncbi:MAG: heavy metal-associated domain-containing protein [Ginsengibacter sp.]
MKEVLLAVVILLSFTMSSQAQKKPSEKATINAPGVQDEACKTRLENQLSRQQGITAVKVDYRRHKITVTWLRDRTNIENIKTVIANMGYDADDVTAEPSALKRLPKSCQHPVKKEVEEEKS